MLLLIYKRCTISFYIKKWECMCGKDKLQVLTDGSPLSSAAFSSWEVAVGCEGRHDEPRATLCGSEGSGSGRWAQPPSRIYCTNYIILYYNLISSILQSAHMPDNYQINHYFFRKIGIIQNWKGALLFSSLRFYGESIDSYLMDTSIMANIRYFPRSGTTRLVGGIISTTRRKNTWRLIKIEIARVT